MQKCTVADRVWHLQLYARVYWHKYWTQGDNLGLIRKYTLKCALRWFTYGTIKWINYLKPPRSHPSRIVPASSLFPTPLLVRINESYVEPSHLATILFSFIFASHDLNTDGMKMFSPFSSQKQICPVMPLLLQCVCVSSSDCIRETGSRCPCCQEPQRGQHTCGHRQPLAPRCIALRDWPLHRVQLS